MDSRISGREGNDVFVSDGREHGEPGIGRDV
jgi:hypothetical protein